MTLKTRPEFSSGIGGSSLDFIDIRDHGAVAGGSASLNLTAFKTAVVEAQSTGQHIHVPGSSEVYGVDGKIELKTNVHIFGDGGHGEGTRSEVQSTATTGSVFWLSGRSSSLKRLLITASAARITGSGYGVELRKTTTGLIGRIELYDLQVVNQPQDGFHIAAAGLGNFELCTATNSGRYGWLLDDGTTALADGIASQLSGIGVFHSVFHRCRAIECVRAGWKMDHEVIWVLLILVCEPQRSPNSFHLR